MFTAIGVPIEFPFPILVWEDTSSVVSYKESEFDLKKRNLEVINNEDMQYNSFQITFQVLF